MLQDILLIVGGLALLTIGAEGLVRGASAIATRIALLVWAPAREHARPVAFAIAARS